MKKIVLALAFVLLGSFMLAGCSKDEILNHYNNIVQSAGSIELTGKSSLQGEKEKGIDDYTGTYTADYANFSGTEYLFGGTSIKREAGKELSIDCTLEVTEGTAKVFWISGSDEAVTLIEATGTYSDTITLPDGGNYIGIECENFTGNIELNMEFYSAGRRQKKKSRRRADNLTRPFETAALIFRAAVSLRLHKPMTTCRDTVADWRLFCRVSFAFSKLT